jgi:hypothetical protein
MSFMRTCDAVTNAFIRLFKKSKILSLTDLDFLYGMASRKYYANCLLYSQKPCDQLFYSVERDQYGRMWALYGPEHTKDMKDKLFVWVASQKEYDITRLADYPPGYIYLGDSKEAPSALSGMSTVFKIRVD